MPLVVVCGIPAAGKSTVATALVDHLQRQSPEQEVVCISPATVNVDKSQGYAGKWTFGMEWVEHRRSTQVLTVHYTSLLHCRQQGGEEHSQCVESGGGEGGEHADDRGAGRAQLHERGALRTLLQGQSGEHDVLRGASAVGVG